MPIHRNSWHQMFKLYRISDAHSDAPLALDFGQDVELASTPKQLVLITNHTAIPAPFRLFVDCYQAGKPPTPPPRERQSTASPKRYIYGS